MQTSFTVPATHSGYRLNLLINAQHLCRVTGGKCVVRGRGNQSKVSLYAADGRYCVVWYPTEGRTRDLDIADLKDAIEHITGRKAFSK